MRKIKPVYYVVAVLLAATIFLAVKMTILQKKINTRLENNESNIKRIKNHGYGLEQRLSGAEDENNELKEKVNDLESE